jgi:hypothetical protein
MIDDIEIKLESTRGKRLQQKQNHIKKQTKIAKSHNNDVKQPHRFAKVKSMNCGQPKCVMCGNPRKIWGQMTMQEKKFKQDTGE